MGEIYVRKSSNQMSESYQKGLKCVKEWSKSHAFTCSGGGWGDGIQLCCLLSSLVFKTDRCQCHDSDRRQSIFTRPHIHTIHRGMLTDKRTLTLKMFPDQIHGFVGEQHKFGRQLLLVAGRRMAYRTIYEHPKEMPRLLGEMTTGLSHWLKSMV